MTDTSRNPERQVSLDALNARIKEAADRVAAVTARAAEVEKAVADTGKTAQKTTVAQEAALRRAAAKDVTPQETAAAGERVRQAASEARARADTLLAAQTNRLSAEVDDVRRAASREAARIREAAAGLPSPTAGRVSDPAAIARAAEQVRVAAEQQQLLEARALEQSRKLEAQTRAAQTQVGPGPQQRLLGPGAAPTGPASAYPGSGAVGPFVAGPEGVSAPGSDYERARAAYQARLNAERAVAAQTAARASIVEEALQQDFARTAAAARQAAAATGSFSEQLAFSTRASGMASNELRIRGALTSEFITAAARGETTFHELGYQVGATIGKFAGWTGAAAAVYGVLGAVTALTQGAYRAEAGVGLLSRVTTNQLPGGADALKQQFIDLSKHYNLPIADVVQSTYGAAKVFGGDLPRALEATRVALLATKVGELSAADSIRYLGAIYRGFRLDASQLPLVFDQINQAQNRLGGNTPDLVSGVAKAAGSFRLAGGDARQLISILTTITRVSGVTADVAGTAVSRSASRVLTPQGAAALRAAGLQPLSSTRSYWDLLADAMKQAHEAERVGDTARVNQIARALVPQGGQFARIFNPLLSAPGELAKAYRTTDPKTAQGSGERELAAAKQAIDQQVSALVVNLGAIGAELARSGALAPLGGLLIALNKALSLTSQLLGDFRDLAGPLAPVLATVTEIAVALKLMRRFDLGASLPAGRDGSAYGLLREQVRRSPADREFYGARQGVRDEADAIQAELVQRRRVVTKELFAEEAALARQQAAAAAQAAAQEATTLSVEERGAINAELTKATAALAAATIRKEEAQLAAADLIPLLDHTNAQLAAFGGRAPFSGAGGRAEGLARAQALGVPLFNPTLNRPTTGVPEGFQQGASGLIAPVGVAEEQAAQGRAAATVARLQAASAAGAAEANALARVKGAASAAVLTAGSAAVAGAKGIQTILQAEVGALTSILAIPFATYEIFNLISEAHKHAAKQLSTVAGASQSGDPEAMHRAAAKARAQHPGIGNQFIMQFEDIADPLGFLPRPNADIDAEKLRQANALDLAAGALANAQRHGKLLTLAQIQSQLARDISTAVDDAAKVAAIAKARQKIIDGFAMRERGPGARGAAKAYDALLAQQQANPDTLDSAAQDKLKKDFDAAQALHQAHVQATVAGIADPITALKVQISATRAQTVALAGFYGTESVQYLQALAQGRQEQQQLEQAQNALIAAKVAVTVASSADPAVQLRAQIDANNRLVVRLAKKYGTQNVEYQQALANGLQFQQQQASQQLQDFQAQQGLQASALSIGATQQQTLTTAVTQAEQFAAKVQSEGRKVAPDTLLAAQTAINNARAALASFLRQQAQELLAAQQTFAASRTDDPIKLARIALRFDTKKVAGAQTPAEQLNARAQVNTDRRGLDTAIVDERLADAEYLHHIGRLTDEALIGKLRDILHLGKISRDKRRQLLSEIYDLQHQTSASALELNVGNIRLPTVYEIRRAVAAGREGQSVTYATQIHVQRPQDATVVADTFDRFHQGTGKSMRRAMGVA